MNVLLELVVAMRSTVVKFGDSVMLAEVLLDTVSELRSCRLPIWDVTRELAGLEVESLVVMGKLVLWEPLLVVRRPGSDCLEVEVFEMRLVCTGMMMSPIKGICTGQKLQRSRDESQ